MKLTINEIELPEQRQLITDYLAGEEPLLCISKYVVGLRRKLRKDMLESKSEKEQKALYATYWDNLTKLYTIERDMGEIARVLKEVNNIDSVDMSILYRFLRRTAPLNQLEFAAVHYRTLPWLTYDITNPKEYFDSWWPFVFIELKEDPREVLKGMKFVNITNNTKIREKDWHSDKETQGIKLIRRGGEIPSHNLELGGIIALYVYIKDNPDENTKTVYCFSMPEIAKTPEIRVYPLVLDVRK